MESVENRFWSKVHKTVDCWLWIGHVATRDPAKDGYGRFNAQKEFGATLAHRVAWILTNGQVPADLLVLHKCDNRKCVNPDHLFLGTDQDNFDDMRAKGRERHVGATGEAHGHAKLTDEKVRAIRKRYAELNSLTKVAKEFGITFQNVSCIKNRKTWRHVV